jgi:hypothetical protein
MLVVDSCPLRIFRGHNEHLRKYRFDNEKGFG